MQMLRHSCKSPQFNFSITQQALHHWNGAKLCRLSYATEKNLMIHGVTRPSLRGIPPSSKQNEVTRKGHFERVRFTVKAAVLKGDEVCKDIIAFSIYDTKPVYL